MSISMISSKHKDHILAKAAASDKYSVSMGTGSAIIMLDSKIIMELDWDQDTDVILKQY